MDIDQALSTHMDWKVKLRRAIQEHQAVDATASRDDQCPLGKWLHGEAKMKFGRLPTHQACVGKHAEFHRAVGAIAQKINAGAYDEAARMLEAGTTYASASTGVAMALVALRKEAKL